MTKKAAELIEENSGRIMEVYTTYPGIKIYTANFFDGIDGVDVRKDEVRYESKNSICSETKYSPNSIKYIELRSSLLKENEEYFHTTIYKLSKLK